MTEQDISADHIFEIRVRGRRLVRTTELVEAQWAVRAAAEAGEGAEIVDGLTGQVIERHPPQRSESRFRMASPAVRHLKFC
jgi:hypothetical protein